MFMSNFTFSSSLKTVTSLLCCNIGLTKLRGSIQSVMVVMLLLLGSVSMYGQVSERSTFFDRCLEDAPPGPSELDVANLYLNQCGDTPAEVTKTPSITGNDCDWEVEYTYFIKCGNFEEEIKIGYVGGDRTPPSLNDGAQVPQGGSNINACFSEAPMGPSEAAIAELYSDNCGDVIVTKSGSPQGDDCSWTAYYKYSIQDTCGNFAAELDVNYSGGDSEAPQLVSELPEGGSGLNLCYNDRPLGPSESDIAALYSDNCGNVTVEKTEETKGSDCKWYAIYTYTIVDDCNNYANPVQVIYSGGDSEPPVLNNVPKDAFYSCIDEVPSPGQVSYTDNCDQTIKIEYVEDLSGLGDYCTGGKIVRTWTATDQCNNSTSLSQNITVQGAPDSELTVPEFPDSLSCSEAYNYEVSDATYSNGVTSGACAISGSITATVTNDFDVCGGKIVISYTGEDACGTPLSAGPYEINVEAAPASQLDPVENFTLSCAEAAAYVAGPLNYNNGEEGDCNLSGSIEPMQKNMFDACGGKITVTWEGEDACGNPLSALIDITVEAAPAPEFAPIEIESSLSCADAAGYVASGLNYDNGEEGLCNISGIIDPQQSNDFDACGGTINITWSGEDVCGNPLSTSATIQVEPAPMAEVTTPEFPESIACADAGAFTAGDATYTNGLTGDCEISGSLTANVESEYDACGGKITITYNGEDACGRPLSAGPFDVDVDPAPEATITVPEFPSEIMCAMAAGFEAGDATYTNGLTGDCEISGSLTANVENDYDLCGGKITITYYGEDACGRILSAGPYDVDVNPAPEASFAPAGHEDISCADAENYQAGTLSYSNGLDGECGINGEVQGVLSGEYTSCGGLLFVDWTYIDECGRTITARKQVKVAPAPAPTVDDVEDFTLSCSDADSYQADGLGYSNGLEGTCNISGTLDPVQTNNFDECGGTITVTWNGEDVCGNVLSASQTITVDPAPMAEFINPLPSIDVTCDLADDYIVTDLAYSNGLDGTCGINGSVPGSLSGEYDACGGTLYVDWKFVDDCGREIEYRKTITVLPAPAPEVIAPEFSDKIACADAAGFEAGNATYSNDLSGLCELSGEIEADVVKQYTACGGLITITYTGMDACENPLSAGPFYIEVDPAPEAVVDAPEFPESIACADADAFAAGNATYSNGLEGTDCEISGEIEADVVKEYTACGGVITVSYTGKDICDRDLSAGPYYIEVDPAPAPTVSAPEFPSEIMCAMAAGFEADNATYTNGLTGDCEISGELEAEVVKEYNACGGTITISYYGYDVCQNPLSAGPFTVTVMPAPEADVTAPEFPSNIACADAAGFEAGNATYSNGLEQTACEISGEIEADVVKEYDACGGTITITYTGKDICDRDLSAGPYVITVDPAPEADVMAPQFPEKIACADAAGFEAGNATYSNGLEETACEISGEIEADVVKEYDACGGTITITYTGKDACDRDLSAGPYVIEVDPAPAPTVSAPEFPSEIMCAMAAGFEAANATYTNGLTGDCEISGELEANVVKDYTACGGTITISYEGIDACDNPLAAGPYTVNVMPAPEADVTAPQFPEKIACADAAGFEAGNATYSNGLEGTDCEISGEIEADVVKEYTACGGVITVSYTGKDICDRDLSAGPYYIEVDPAPAPTVSAPEFPSEIMCAMAAGFEADNATYTNGLTGDCEISGELEAEVVKEYNACGGTITISYYGYDVCQNPLSAGPFTVTVMPAPEADVTAPEFPSNIACADAAGFEAGNATYSNGLEQTACEISGEIEADVVKDYDACGGTITITYTGKDICDRDLSAGPYVIAVDPAPEADVMAPQFPEKIACVDAEGFEAGNATYSNGLEETACEISGEIEADVVKDYDVCGGTITITYTGKDACDRDLSAGPYVIEVDPAPAPYFNEIDDASIACEDLATYVPEYLSYTNGIDGPCGINGEVQGVAQPFDGSCGTFEVDFSYESCGVTITAKQVITVIDETAPVLVGELPQGISDVNGCLSDAPAAPTEEEIEALFSDNCGNVNATLEVVSPEQNTDCLWAVLYRYTIQDDCGNFAAPVKIYHNGGDMTAPELVGELPEGVTGLQCKDENPGAPDLSAIQAAYTDNCGDVIITPFEPVMAGDDCEWSFTYEYEIKDSCGNKLPNLVIVNSGADTMPPVLEGEIPMGMNSVNACIDSDLGEPTEEEIAALFSDNCAEITADNVYKIEKLAIGDDCEWIRVFEYTVSDDCDNTYPTFKINYQGGDTEDPTFEVFPDDITIECSEIENLELFSILSYLDDNQVPFPVPADNCSVTLDWEADVVAGPQECPTIAVCTKKFIATDGCGNSTERTLTVTIVDTEGPVIDCPEDEDFGLVDEAPTDFADKATWVDCQGSGETADFTDSELEVSQGQQTQVGSELRFMFYEGYILTFGDAPAGTVNDAPYYTGIVTDLNGNHLPAYGSFELIFYFNNQFPDFSVVQNGEEVGYGAPDNNGNPSCDSLDWYFEADGHNKDFYMECAQFEYTTEYSFTRTFTAYDACGNIGECSVTYTWNIAEILYRDDMTVSDSIEFNPTNRGQESEVSEEEKIDFKAYPVPFDNEVTISYEFDYRTDVTIELFDTKGLLVSSVTNNRYVAGSSDSTKLDLTKTPSQVLYVKLTTNKGTVTKKIVSSGR